MSVYKTFMLENLKTWTLDLPLMDCSSLHSSTGSNVLVTALFHGSRYSCEVSLLLLYR